MNDLCQRDYTTLVANDLQLSLCFFYYPDIDGMIAMKMLKNSLPGTFLIRNSLDCRFLYALSVKTQQWGVVNMRIAYHEGWFSFDCDKRMISRKFRSVLELIDHNMATMTKWERKTTVGEVVEIEFIKPYRLSVPSLKHLSTIEVNKLGEDIPYCCNDDDDDDAVELDYDDIVDSIRRNYPFKV